MKQCEVEKTKFGSSSLQKTRKKKQRETTYFSAMLHQMKQENNNYIEKLFTAFIYFGRFQFGVFSGYM